MNSDPSASQQNNELRRTCAILESIADRFEPASPEHQALREAASAYTFLHQYRALLSAFRNWRLAGSSELTPQMAEALRRMGIGPDVE